jgi:hypothetical protein
MDQVVEVLKKYSHVMDYTVTDVRFSISLEEQVIEY